MQLIAGSVELASGDAVELVSLVDTGGTAERRNQHTNHIDDRLTMQPLMCIVVHVIDVMKQLHAHKYVLLLANYTIHV